MESWRWAARPGAGQGTYLAHREFAAGAARNLGLFRDSCSYCSDGELPARKEADALACLFGCGVAEAVVADGSHAAREDVAEVSCDEFGSGDGGGALGVAFGAVFPAEGHYIVVHGDDSGVAYGGAADVGAEVFDGVFPGSEGLDVYSPVLLPNIGIDLDS